MPSSLAIKERFKAHGEGKTAKGCQLFENELRNQLGLCDKNGNDHKDAHGNPLVKDAKLDPSEFSLKELAEGILGHEATDIFFNSGRRRDLARVYRAQNEISRTYGTGTPQARQALQESTGFGIDPTAFANINTFTAVTGGLVERAIFKGFTSAEFIMDRVFATKSSKANGGKWIGVTPFGDIAKIRLPNQPHPAGQIEERYITTPGTDEWALSCRVTKEAVFFDLTGNLLTEAYRIGESLKLRKEYLCTSVLIGGTNNFKFMELAVQNTYQTSRTTGYLNDASNPIYDWTALNNQKVVMSKQQDPKTGKPIMVKPNFIVCCPFKENLIKMVVNSTESGLRTGAGSSTPQTTSMPLYTSKTNSNPFAGQFEVVSSPYVLEMLLAAAADGGLAVSTEAAAQEYWFGIQQNGEEDSAFVWIQNWPLTVSQAPENSLDLVDKGQVAAYFANYRGVAASVRPWMTNRNKN